MRVRNPGVKRRRVGRGLCIKGRREICPKEDGAYKGKIDVGEEME